MSAPSQDPAPEPTLHRFQRDACELAYFERHPQRKGRGPTLLLVHATGFHARVWDQILARLPAVHSIALDQRGHGRSERQPIRHWKVMGEDQAALLRELDLRDVVGVGHSMGGHAMIDAAAACSDRFRRLVLIDPVVASPESYVGDEDPWRIPEGELHPAAKRRNRFESAEAMIERLKDRSSFPLFDPQILRDDCEYGVGPAPDGDGVTLLCNPEVEASVYMSSRTNGGVFDSAHALEIPVLLLRAREPTAHLTGPLAFSTSPTWPALVQEFRNGREIHYADKTHFLPMEIPDEVAALIREELEAAASPTGAPRDRKTPV